jgi:hypothetical protein
MNLQTGGISANRANKRKKITPPSNRELIRSMYSGFNGKRRITEIATRIVKSTM